MKRNITITLLAALLALSAVAARAETRYVSDQLVITLRAGKGTEFKIIDYLRTGDALEVLSEEGNYLKVRTAKGEEGWVRSRYVTSDTPKALVIAGLNKQLEDLKAISGDARELAAERDRLTAEKKRLMAENRRLEAERERAHRKELIYWFLAGAGVLFIGWLMGKASRRKRYY
jgi:SH3 domain protein